MLNFSKISKYKVGWLEKPFEEVEIPFEEVEIFWVVKDFNGDKAPRLDGFPGFFLDFLGHYQNQSYGRFSIFFFFFDNAPFE